MSEQQKWVAKLLGYDYEIHYLPGRENSIANALFYQPGSTSPDHLFIPQVDIWEETKEVAKGNIYMEFVEWLV